MTLYLCVCVCLCYSPSFITAVHTPLFLLLPWRSEDRHCWSLKLGLPLGQGGPSHTLCSTLALWQCLPPGPGLEIHTKPSINTNIHIHTYTHTHKSHTRDLRWVVTFPLPELGSGPAGPTAHAPLAPGAPVPVHMLRDGRLAHTLSCPAPLTQTHKHTHVCTHKYTHTQRYTHINTHTNTHRIVSNVHISNE